MDNKSLKKQSKIVITTDDMYVKDNKILFKKNNY